ncbi:MAG TPA: DUF1624 domain-containing protein [Candidatus Nocardiopsis merdipullorum]|nr:DUF1624 domain-containing protein [Candidatus Nocardiopsis merdipullorum]
MAQKRSDHTAAPAAPGKLRIDGVDAARALAVFGMFVVHMGVESLGLLSPEGYAWDLHDLVRGNSSALFAFLAGVSLAMMTGRTRPVRGEPLRRAAVRVLTRALFIGLLGVVLDALAVPVAVILTYYAGFFVLALPLAAFRAGALWTVAGVLAVLGPPLSYLIRDAFITPQPRTGAVTSFGEFFLTGYYPAITFMVFVFAGMAVGRMDMGATAVRARLLLTGGVLTVFGYLGSWVMLYPLGGLDRLVEQSMFMEGRSVGAVDDPQLLENLRAGVLEEAASISGQVPTDSWWWLAVNTAHTGTTFEIAVAVGQALIVLVMCMWLAEHARILMYPLTSVGRMPLTIYSGHIFVLALIVTPDDAWRTPWLWEGFVLGSIVLAVAWRLLVSERGPAEMALRAAGNGAVSLYDENRSGHSVDQRRPPSTH